MDTSTTNLLLLIILALLLCISTLLFFFVRHQNGRLVIQRGGEGTVERTGNSTHHEQLHRDELRDSSHRVKDIGAIRLRHPFLPGRDSHRIPLVCKKKAIQKDKSYTQKARLRQMSSSLFRHANMGADEAIRALQRPDVPIDDPNPTQLPSRQSIPYAIRSEARLRLRRDPVGASGGSSATSSGQRPNSADATPVDQRAEADGSSNGDDRQADSAPRSQPGLQDCD